MCSTAHPDCLLHSRNRFLQVLYEDAMAAVQAIDQGPYDLCPPEYAAPAGQAAGAAKPSAAAPVPIGKSAAGPLPRWAVGTVGRSGFCLRAWRCLYYGPHGFRTYSPGRWLRRLGIGSYLDSSWDSA